MTDESKTAGTKTPGQITYEATEPHVCLAIKWESLRDFIRQFYESAAAAVLAEPLKRIAELESITAALRHELSDVMVVTGSRDAVRINLLINHADKLLGDKLTEPTRRE